jgi:peroxiredoxin
VFAALGIAIASYALVQRQVGPAVTFSTLDGRQIRLEEMRGRVVMVTFWATSCSICVGEMPDLIQAYRDYRHRGFEIIAVAMTYDPPEHVRHFAAGRSLPFPVVLDTTGELARSFNGTQVVPTTFLIDTSGKFVSQTLGAIDFAKLRQYLDASLGT